MNNIHKLNACIHKYVYRSVSIISKTLTLGRLFDKFGNNARQRMLYKL